uniref:Transmembrane 9 superfamily member n=1 Tax=Naja naja TaxID=35670 RepID=A0A8C6XTE7_NAJNA
ICFYVPGVAPINFHRNAPVEIKAVKLTSSRTQLPYEYYSLPFCRPVKIKYKAENLGNAPVLLPGEPSACPHCTCAGFGSPEG